VTAAAEGRRWLGLAVLCFSVLLISLDQTVLNVALPTLIDDLHPSASGLPWIADGYTLTNGVLLLFGGALGDRYGRRLTFLVGVAIFGAGSLFCALVHDTGDVIAARAVMGAGAALLLPATLSLITTTFQGQERARAIGIWAGVSGIGTAAGPLLGGWMLQHFWWGSVFLINVPVAVLALAGGALFLNESRAPHRRSLDIPGVLLSAAGLAAVTYGLITGPDDGWLSATVLGSLIGGVILVAVFVWWELRQAEPLVEMKLFRNRTFSSAVGAVTAVFFALFGASYLLSQFIQFVQGVNSFGVGLRFLPIAIGTLITANLAVRITARVGLRATMVAGIAMLTASMVLLAVIGATGNWTLLASFSLLGLGLGMVISPASNAIMGTLPPAKVGAGAGLRSMVQLLGGSFGVAIIGSLATARYRSQISHALTTTLRGLPASAHGPVTDQIGDAFAVAARLPGPLGRATTSAAGQAFLSGVHLAGIVAAAVMVVALVVAAVTIPNRSEAARHDEMRATVERRPEESLQDYDKAE
jgi:MFS transporter, DHA2 family, multidrug resistance protein